MRSDFTRVFEIALDAARRQGVTGLELILSGEDASLTRFANNTIHQNVIENNAGPGVKIDDATTPRADRWAKYREYLDGLDEHLSADADLKPGSHAFVKLRALSDRLGELQEKDFQAKQLKSEIDRALAAAADGGGGGLLKAFASIGRKDDDAFDP